MIPIIIYLVFATTVMAIMTIRYLDRFNLDETCTAITVLLVGLVIM